MARIYRKAEGRDALFHRYNELRCWLRNLRKKETGAGSMFTIKGVVRYEILASPAERYMRKRGIPRGALLTAIKRFPRFDHTAVKFIYYIKVFNWRAFLERHVCSKIFLPCTNRITKRVLRKSKSRLPATCRLCIFPNIPSQEKI